MIDTKIEPQAMLTSTLTAIQTSLFNYPTYNLFTQIQDSLRTQLVQRTKNPLNGFGQKYFSQNDEDGILIEILNRLNLLENAKENCFIEFGVGNGQENNSLILLMHGFKGTWIGNEELSVDLSNSNKLQYIKTWLTLDNISEVVSRSLQFLGKSEIDVMSMDLDGNDLYFINFFILSGLLPKVIIAEYNGKFPPPIEFTIEYNSEHNFNSDYMGASIQSLNNVLDSNYYLVACNIAGCNAFFVRKDFAGRFPDVPKSIKDKFMPANYGIVTRVGHPTSPKTIERFL